MSSIAASRPPPIMKLPPAALAGLLVVACLASTAAAQPTLSRAVPAGIPAGITTDVTLHGAKLAGAKAVWTSFEADVEIVADESEKPNAAQLHLRITPAKGLPVQIGGLAVATAEGATAPLLVMIDDLPSVAENGQNISRESAQSIAALTAVDGVSQAGSSDHFAVEATAGQKLSLEVVAQRMGSKFDPVLWLRDSDGNVLRLADDDASLAADCRFSHTIEKAGRYLLEVRDNAYRAGLAYRLRVGDFPIVSTPYPLSVQGGEKAQLELTGEDAGDAAPVVVEPEQVHSAPSQPIVARRKGGASSALAMVMVSDLNEMTELDSSSSKEPLTPPCAINGRLQNPGERDAFTFMAGKGDKLTLHAFSQSLGSPTLVSFQVINDKGAPLAESPFDASGQPRLTWSCPADGAYTLSVRDLLDRGGPQFTYRVSLEPARADFSLTLKTGTPTLYNLPGQDAYLAVEVDCQRQGYDGPIELTVAGPGKWKLQQETIREKATAAKLLLVPDEPFEPGTLLPLQIIGTAKIDGQDVRRTAGTLAVLRAATPELLHPPAQLDGWLSVGVKGEAKPLFELPAPKEGVRFTRGVEETTLVLTPKRVDANLKTNLTLKLEDLPKGFTYRLKVDGKAPKEKYELTLRGPKDAEAAEHELTLLAFGDIGGVGQVLRQPVMLRVVEPKKDKDEKEKPAGETEPKPESTTEPKPESKKG
ncbi:MAG: hypothetical protein RIC55_19495 [Pirellulaceae bacterium]